MLIALGLGEGVSTLAITAAVNPAGRPTAPASTLGRAHVPASPSNTANAATPNPTSMPKMAPHEVMRFHHTDSTRVGNIAEALNVSDHKNSFSGSAGAAIA